MNDESVLGFGAFSFPFNWNNLVFGVLSLAEGVVVFGLLPAVGVVERIKRYRIPKGITLGSSVGRLYDIAGTEISFSACLRKSYKAEVVGGVVTFEVQTF